MQDWMKNPLFLIVASVTLLNLIFLFVGKVIVEKAADEVIERLQKDYSPSPYGPGLDPDRINMDAIHPALSWGSQSMFYAEGSELQREIFETNAWMTGWESERGFVEQ